MQEVGEPFNNFSHAKNRKALMINPQKIRNYKPLQCETAKYCMILFCSVFFCFFLEILLWRQTGAKLNGYCEMLFF